jgi:predicted CopG family antitoxin
VAEKGEGESFSDLFERLIKNKKQSSIDALKKLRGSIEFEEGAKEKILADIASKRSERRI